MTPTLPLLSAQDLAVWFPNGNGGLHAIDHVSFDVPAKEFVCIVGPSGSGKTTLLRLLAGLLRPTRGEVLLEGQSLRRPRRGTGFVFQQANLMPWRTVAQNIELPLELEGEPPEATRRRAAELLSLVGLEGFASSYPRDLSGGMAQRVAIARALVHDPDLLLLDEPFGSLDALTRERMNAELLRIWSLHQRTVVMVTHSISEAVLLSDRILVFTPRPGRVRAEFAVPLERPRRSTLTADPAFTQIAQAVRAEIVD